MYEPSHAFLKKLLETPSPSGYERPIQDVVRGWAADFADEVRTDRHGNVLAIRYAGGPHPTLSHPQGEGREGEKEPPRVMLAGHCDQIGLMVH